MANVEDDEMPKTKAVFVDVEGNEESSDIRSEGPKVDSSESEDKEREQQVPLPPPPLPQFSRKRPRCKMSCPRHVPPVGADANQQTLEIATRKPARKKPARALCPGEQCPGTESEDNEPEEQMPLPPPPLPQFCYKRHRCKISCPHHAPPVVADANKQMLEVATRKPARKKPARALFPGERCPGNTRRKCFFNLSYPRKESKL